MRDLLSQLRFSLRLLRKGPTTTALAVLALALGIGMTAAMYSLVYTMVLKDLPFEDAHRLYHLERSQLSHGFRSLEVTQHDFLDWQQQQTSFDELAAFDTDSLNLSGGDRTERYSAALVTPNFFRLMRVEPILGRDFIAADAEPGAPDVALLGYHLWRTRYGGTAEVLGSSIRVDGVPTTVIGIMPEDFEFPLRESLWTPFKFQTPELERGTGRTMEVIGRLAEGRTLARAREELSSIAGRLAVQFPDSNEGVDAVIKPYKEEFVDEGIRTLLWVMLGAVSLVLLIACANVANLLLARASARSKELAIRSALGSSRRRVVLQLLADSLLIALMGGVLGIGVLRACIAWLNRVIAVLEPPFWFLIEIDAGILAFVFSIALASAVLAGLFPALHATRANLNDILTDSARGGSSLRLGVLSRSLVVLEIAFATALLLCAGLTIRTVINLQNLELAFDPEGIQVARIYPAESAVPDDAEELELFYRRLLQNLEARPEVATASLGSSVPTNGALRARYAVDGEVFPEEEAMPRSRLFRVTPDYFDTFAIPAQQGRLLDPRDTADSLPVALVNRSFAQREWPGESPVGRRVRFGRSEENPWRTVVGVVPDQLVNVQDENADLAGVYLPFVQSPQRGMAVVLNGRNGTRNLSRIISEELARLAPDESPYRVQTMPELLELNTFQNRVLGIIFSAFAVAALLLTAIGLYGVMAFAVGQRTQEIGVRMAFGARRGQILGLVLRQGLSQTLLGLSMGWALAYVLARFLSIALYQVSPSDPPSYAGTTLLLGSIAMIACAVPARRAAGLNPVAALREN